MKIRTVTSALLIVLISILVTPSFMSGAGQAKNHFSQVVEHSKLQMDVLNKKYQSFQRVWADRDGKTIQVSATLSRTEIGYLTEVETTPTI